MREVYKVKQLVQRKVLTFTILIIMLVAVNQLQYSKEIMKNAVENMNWCDVHNESCHQMRYFINLNAQLRVELALYKEEIIALRLEVEVSDAQIAKLEKMYANLYYEYSREA